MGLILMDMVTMVHFMGRKPILWTVHPHLTQPLDGGRCTWFGLDNMQRWDASPLHLGHFILHLGCWALMMMSCARVWWRWWGLLATWTPHDDLRWHGILPPCLHLGWWHMALGRPSFTSWRLDITTHVALSWLICMIYHCRGYFEGLAPLLARIVDFLFKLCGQLVLGYLR